MPFCLSTVPLVASMPAEELYAFPNSSISEVIFRQFISHSVSNLKVAVLKRLCVSNASRNTRLSCPGLTDDPAKDSMQAALTLKKAKNGDLHGILNVGTKQNYAVDQVNAYVLLWNANMNQRSV